MEKNANKKPRDLSWALPVILILVVAVSVLGVIAFIGDIKENTRQKTLDEYNDRVVRFTVFGDGTYSEEKPTYVIDMEVSQEDVRGVSLCPLAVRQKRSGRTCSSRRIRKQSAS